MSDADPTATSSPTESAGPSDAGATMTWSGTGVWSGELRYGDPAQARDQAAELESLGYDALWIPDVGGDLLSSIENLLSGTSTVTIATGILNLWMHEPATVADHAERMRAEHGDRLMIGIGVSHAPLIDASEAGRYRKPLAAMVEFLDGLDAAGAEKLPPARRVLAALGPKMLEVARTRSAGAHPYLVTPEHTAIVREALGAEALVLPEQAVVLDKNPETARATARRHLKGYATLPNYVNNWLRLGYTEADVADGVSDRLVDALVVWGDEATIAARVAEHYDAGATAVCVQALAPSGRELPLDDLRALAPALLTA